MNEISTPNGIPAFSLSKTVTSGQTFRWLVAPTEAEIDTPLSNPNTTRFYRPIYYNNQHFVFVVEQTDENTLKWETYGNVQGLPKQVRKMILMQYLGYEYDYTTALEQLKETDSALYNTISPAKVSLVQDDPFETIISFICSPQATIDRIYRMQREIETTFGTPVETPDGTFYTFPTPEQLSNATEQQLKDCNLGYRASYVKKTVDKICNENLEIPPKSVNYPTEELSAELQKFVGVGEKVAECILLYSYRRSEVIPIDTRIQQMVESRYDETATTTAKAKTALYEHWNKQYAGYYQLLLYDLAADELTA